MSQLRRADAFLYVRTAMSESGAFEVSYNVFAEPRAPMFFAVRKHAPIKTTLLRELEEVCDVTYREFEDPEELRGDLQHFFHRVANGATSTPISPATTKSGEWIPWALVGDRCEATIWRIGSTDRRNARVRSRPCPVVTRLRKGVHLGFCELLNVF